MRQVAMIVILLGLGSAGCGSRNSYTKTETGPHGVVTIKKVPYTPEELTARDAAERYAQSRPTDPQMIAIEQNWPKLTEAQRISILRTVEQMAAGK